jgi:hypothetical protein
MFAFRLILPSIVLLFTALVAAAEEPVKPLPRPEGELLAKADKEVRELFADKLQATRLPADRAKLAKELLAIAAEPDTSMPNERFALCVLVRDLAVAGRDKPTAFAASNIIAENYRCGGSSNADDLFGEAQELWSRSEKTRDTGDQLELQAKAAELYYLALPCLDGLKKVIAEKRLEVEDKNDSKVEKRITKKNNADLKLLIGTWNVKSSSGYSGQWTFYANGKVVALNQTYGVWQFDSEKVKITWKSGAWETFNRPIDPKNTKGDGGTARVDNTLQASKVVDNPK